MDPLNIRDVVLIDRVTVGQDGRIYVGKEHAGDSFKIAVIDDDHVEE